MRWIWFCVLVVLTGCQDGPKREKVGEVPLGYRGKARLNPYLAAERYLDEKGWEVESSRTWSNYGKETSMIFMPASFLQTKGMAMRALEWMEKGGILVLTIQGGEPERNDFTDVWGGDVPEEGDYSGLDELFSVLGVELQSRPDPDFVEDELEEDGHLSREWEVSRTSEDFGDHALEFEGDVTLTIEDEWSWMPEIDGSSRMLGTGYGAGAIIIMAHARPLRNPYLARADHAEFLEFLAENYGDGKMVFLYGSSTSFFGLIWKEGWMVVIGALVALGCWLWMRIPRFGPVLKDRAVKRTPYGAALTTSARFLWRTGQVEALVRPLRERLEKENEGAPETLYERLADESGMTREEVAEALTEESPKDPGHILKIVRKLQTLLKR